MRNQLLFQLAFVFLVFLSKFCKCEDSPLKPLDKSKWVNPSNMINYDSDVNDAAEFGGNVGNDEEVKKLRVDLFECRRDLLYEAQKKKETDQSCSPTDIHRETILFKQLLKRFAEKLGLNLLSNPKNFDAFYEYDVDLKLTKAQIVHLSQTVESDVNSMQDAVEILIKSFVRVRRRLEPKEETGWIDSLKLYIPAVNVLLLIPISLFYFNKIARISYRSLLSLLAVACFLASVVWNWLHLFKVKQAEIQARLMLSVPETCMPKSNFGALTDWLRGVTTFSSTKRECVQFQKDLLIDPFWEVSPMEAVAVTFVKFLLEPMELIGRNIARFFRALLEDLPVTVYPIVLLSLLVFLFLILLFFGGYRFRAFYGLLTLEPAAREQRRNETLADGPARPAVTDSSNRETIPQAVSAPQLSTTPQLSAENVD